MLVGGSASILYTRIMQRNNLNGIALVSYQGEGTPGRSLLEKGQVTFGWKNDKMLCRSKKI